MTANGHITRQTSSRSSGLAVAVAILDRPKSAMQRNRFVADMALAVVVAHAAPGSKIEAFSLELLAAGKRLYTFDHPGNVVLIRSGARPIVASTDWRNPG